MLLGEEGGLAFRFVRVFPKLGARHVNVAETSSFQTSSMAPTLLRADPVGATPIGAGGDQELDRVDLTRLNLLVAERAEHSSDANVASIELPEAHVRILPGQRVNSSCSGRPGGGAIGRRGKYAFRASSRTRSRTGSVALVGR